MTRKALFFDIDGTLWKRQDGIQDNTLEALRQVRSNGHLIFINTGRSKAHVIDGRLLSAGWDGMVAGCGTYVDVAGKVLKDESLDTAELERIIQGARAHKVRIILEGRDLLYFDDEEFADDPYGRILIREAGPNRATIRDCWGKWLAGKFSIDIDDPEQGRLWLESISGRYELLSHTPTVYEIVPKGYDKARGMKEVCDYLGMDMADSIAFGDGYNDRAMLEAAGQAVVIDCAPAEIQALADIITTGPNDDGIGRALRRLGLI